MKIENVGGPAINALPTGKPDPTPAMSAREKAIQAFMNPTNATQAAQQEQQTPVQNPSQVSPEEFGALAKKYANSGQSDNNEAPQKSVEAPAQEEYKVSSEPLSSKYAILARKEKALRLREQQLKAKEAALAKPIEVAEAPKPTFDESKYVPRDRLTQDPFTVLNELGLTYDQLTELAMNAPKPEQLALMNQIKALESKIASLENETKSTKQSFEQSQQEQNAQALKLMEGEARKLVSSDPSFELIKATPGAIKEVVKLIEKTYYEDGDFLSVEEAAQQVEDYLADEAIKYAKIKKIQQKLQPTQTPAAKQSTAPAQQPQLKTLTNAVSGSRPLGRRERAILAFEGKLK